MTRIILVRHCEAAGNLNRRFQGHTDAEVTENGKKQLELLALRMRNVKIDYLYSSPLKPVSYTHLLYLLERVGKQSLLGKPIEN